MKENIGTVLRQLRINKNIKQKDLVNDNISLSQIVNIEKSIHIPSTDKFIYILNALNTTYEEFIYYLDDESLKEKKLLKDRFTQLANSSNVNLLEELAEEIEKFSMVNNDIFFKHLLLQIHATIKLLTNELNFQETSKYLEQIKKYFAKVDNWGYYELILLNNCLFMFSVENITTFGNMVISSIEKNYDLYRNKEIVTTLLNNFATYSLDDDKHVAFSLRCSSFNEHLSFETQNATTIARAKILQQIAYYKLRNGLFDEEELVSLIRVFSSVGLKHKYNGFITLCMKHGIDLNL